MITISEHYLRRKAKKQQQRRLRLLDRAVEEKEGIKTISLLLMIPFIILSSWRYEDVIILFQFLDLDDLEPLDEEAIKKKMEEINEMFDVSGRIYHQRRCQF